jgi:hypothetical protein
MQIQSEIPHFKAQCNRRAIHVPGDDPTPEQIIPIIEQRLAAHQNHRSRNTNPWTGDYAEWKARHDDLTEFLAELRAAAEKADSEKGRARCPQRAGAAALQPLPQQINSDAASVINAPTPPPADPPKNISAQNAGLSGSTIDNQQPSAGSDPGPAGSMPGFAGPVPVPAGSEPPPAPSTHPQSPSKTNADTRQSNEEVPPSKPNEHEHQKEQPQEQPQPKTDPHKQIKIEDYLQGDSIEAALDLQSHLAGRSPLDNLPPNEQQAIVRLLKDYQAWRVLEVVQQPRPIGLGIRTSKTALNLFARRFKDAKEEAIKAANQKAIDDLMAAANASDDIFQTAVQRCIKSRLLTAASEPNSDLEAISALVLSLTRLRKQALAEQNKS